MELCITEWRYVKRWDIMRDTNMPPSEGHTRQDDLTIDRLAARAGMTVRTVRSHVTRRLLPSPRLVGRTAYYGDEHLARLELIATLQREGFNLGSIERLVRSVPFESSEQVLAFHRALVSPWLKEEPVEL